jgi:hypothetical protein
MPKARVTFQRLVQDSQDYESFEPNEDHIVSRVFFYLEVGGQLYQDMTVEVMQPHGTMFESEPLEVGPPLGSYGGKWNHREFADLVERYYRQLIGSHGHGIRISGGSNIRMRNNTFVSTMTGEFTIPS